jgi:hypothetical protein
MSEFADREALAEERERRHKTEVAMKPRCRPSSRR